jgi:hypothetical protein
MGQGTPHGPTLAGSEEPPVHARWGVAGPVLPFPVHPRARLRAPTIGPSAYAPIGWSRASRSGKPTSKGILTMGRCRPLSTDEIEAMKAHCHTPRGRAILAFFERTGY